VDDDRVPVGSFASGTKVGIGLYGIGDYNTQHTDSVLSYGFAKGDRIRFIKDNGGFFFNEYIDLKIRDYDPAGIAYVDNIVSVGQVFPGMLFEIYTPKLQSDQEIYWEFGQCFDIGNPGTSTRFHKGGDSTAALTATDQSTTFVGNVSTVPATGVFTTGDTYYRLRNMTYGTSTTTSGTRLWFIEDANFSDFFSSKVADIGRPNRVDKDFRQVRRPTVIYYSGLFIPETKINNLNSFFDTDFETYERGYQSIQKLYYRNKRLRCYQELKVGLIPVNEQVMFDNAANSVVGLSAKVLNNIVYYDGEFGIALNPESHAVYGNREYFTDLNRGASLRISDDGITPISEYKMHNHFTDLFRQLLATGVRPNIYGVYDMKFGEYVIAVEQITVDSVNAPPPGETIAFNENSNRWETFYSYQPEFMVSNGVGIVTFKNGRPYTHNTNALYNNFYGTQFSSEVHAVSNLEGSKMKVYQAYSQESTDVWECFDIVTPSGQQSNLLTTDFEKKENIFYSNFYFDTNTPNVTNPLFEGDPLRDASMLVKMRNSNTGFVKLFAVNFYIQASERSNQ
jgi:hypothetical protein